MENLLADKYFNDHCLGVGNPNIGPLSNISLVINILSSTSLFLVGLYIYNNFK